jgi:hypothetical protein
LSSRANTVSGGDAVVEVRPPGTHRASTSRGWRCSRTTSGWTTSRADNSNLTHAQKVIRNRPATLKDACWDAAGTKYEELPTLDPAARCNQLFPVHENVRVAAGGSVAGDVLKCQLKPVNEGDYNVAFTGSELSHLKAIFPGGVCDWSRPGVGQKKLEATWLAFPTAGKPERLAGK